MTPINIKTPFSGPVFFEDTVSSTMIVSRDLAGRGCPHGTVIAADFQDAGRGRVSGRTWETEKGKNLIFTILLRYGGMPAIPRGLTLRAGLAVCLAVEDFSPVLRGRLRIKWPNDVIADTRKLCGILAEADGGTVHLGIGINVTQNNFPPHLCCKATSIARAAGADIDPSARFDLLEKILLHLHMQTHTQMRPELDTHSAPAGGTVPDWRGRIEERLYRKGEHVTFIRGAADSGTAVTGILSGIGPDGELLLLPDGADKPSAFFSGELLLKGKM